MSELGLHGADIVSGVPDVFGEGAAEIVDAEIGTNSGAGFEGLPLLGEARPGTGSLSGAMFAKQVDDWSEAIGGDGQRLKDLFDFCGDGQSLVDVAFGVERQRVEFGIVVGGSVLAAVR